jgi:uncharacterized membrane protein
MTLLYGLLVIAIVAGLYFLSMLLGAIMSVIGGIVGVALIGGAVIAWIAVCVSGYRQTKQPKKTGVGK